MGTLDTKQSQFRSGLGKCDQNGVKWKARLIRDKKVRGEGQPRSWGARHGPPLKPLAWGRGKLVDTDPGSSSSHREFAQLPL